NVNSTSTVPFRGCPEASVTVTVYGQLTFTVGWWLAPTSLPRIGAGGFDRAALRAGAVDVPLEEPPPHAATATATAAATATPALLRTAISPRTPPGASRGTPRRPRAARPRTST